MTDFVLLLPDESISESEVYSNGATKLAEETVTGTEVYTNGATKLLTETVTGSDSILRATTRLLTDSLTLSEVIKRAVTMPLTETITESDSSSVVHVYLTAKYLKTNGSNIETDIQNYLNSITAGVEPPNIKAIALASISSDNYGVLIVHT